MALIFVVPRSHFYLPTGVLPFDSALYTALLNSAFFHDREKCEQNAAYLQLVTYCVLEDVQTGEVFTYQRSRKGDEGRLHAKYSLGVGGHIDFTDSSYGDSADQIVEHAVRRELLEEVGIDVKIVPEPTAFLYDPTDDVGQVHLGLVYRFKIDGLSAHGGETDVLVNRQMLPWSGAAKTRPRFERWSQLLIDDHARRQVSSWWQVRGIRKVREYHAGSQRWRDYPFEDDRSFREKPDAEARLTVLKERHAFYSVNVSPWRPEIP